MELLVVPQKIGPAQRPKNVCRINANEADGDAPPVHHCQLHAELVPVKLVSVLSINADSNKHRQHNQAQDQLILLQANSVPQIYNDSKVLPGSKRAAYWDANALEVTCKPSARLSCVSRDFTRWLNS